MLALSTIENFVEHHWQIYLVDIQKGSIVTWYMYFRGLSSTSSSRWGIGSCNTNSLYIRGHLACSSDRVTSVLLSLIYLQIEWYSWMPLQKSQKWKCVRGSRIMQAWLLKHLTYQVKRSESLGLRLVLARDSQKHLRQQRLASLESMPMGHTSESFLMLLSEFQLQLRSEKHHSAPHSQGKLVQSKESSLMFFQDSSNFCFKTSSRGLAAWKSRDIGSTHSKRMNIWLGVRQHEALLCRVAPSTALGKPKHRSTILPLPFIESLGGPVSRTAFRVVKIYPQMFRCQRQNGKHVWMTPKAHSAALKESDTRLQKVRMRRIKKTSYFFNLVIAL